MLPNVEEERLTNALSKLETQLTSEEQERNKTGKIMLFV